MKKLVMIVTFAGCWYLHLLHAEEAVIPETRKAKSPTKCNKYRRVHGRIQGL